MATILVLLSGWVGLAVATVNLIIAQATYAQFFATWMQVGLVTLLAMGLVFAARRVSGFQTAPQV